MEKMGLTLKEASEITGIGYQQLHCWAEERPDFPAFKIGRKMIIPTQQLREYMGKMGGRPGRHAGGVGNPGGNSRKAETKSMSKPLIFTVLLMATALLAGYTAEPEPQLISYKVTVRDGESVWDACAKVASSKDDVREVVYNTLKENRIKNPGNVQPGTELVIRVKEMK